MQTDLIHVPQEAQTAVKTTGATAPLKLKVVTMFEVKAHELDAYIEQVLGHSFEVVADQEMGDDSLKDFNVTGQLSDYDRQNVEKFKATGKGSWITATLLNYLAAEGLLEKDTYLIRNT
ncbi:MAG: hypothetical protein WC028_31685 [Candidatus Obscuribacterales bacterium]